MNITGKQTREILNDLKIGDCVITKFRDGLLNSGIMISKTNLITIDHDGSVKDIDILDFVRTERLMTFRLEPSFTKKSVAIDKAVSRAIDFDRISNTIDCTNYMSNDISQFEGNIVAMCYKEIIDLKMIKFELIKGLNQFPFKIIHYYNF